MLCFSFLGCENPFGSKADSPLLGVWQVGRVIGEIRSIAFLDKGRYYENNVQVGTYVVLNAAPGASGAENLVFVTHSVRIDYISGDRIEVAVRTLSHTKTEIRLDGVSGIGGPPPGEYYKLHTGDGL